MVFSIQCKAAELDKHNRAELAKYTELLGKIEDKELGKLSKKDVLKKISSLISK